MRGIKNEIEAAGARLVFIGNGATAFARRFRDTFAPDCEVLTDPLTASYALLGARRGIWIGQPAAAFGYPIGARHSG